MDRQPDLRRRQGSAKRLAFTPLPNPLVQQHAGPVSLPGRFSFRFWADFGTRFVAGDWYDHRSCSQPSEFMVPGPIKVPRADTCLPDSHQPGPCLELR